MSTPKAVANYGLELLDILRKASRSEVRLPITTEGKAINMRQQLYSLRAAMRRENHYMLPAAEQVKITIEQIDGIDGPGPIYLVISPAGGDFADAMKAAGIESDIESILDPIEDLEDEPLTDPMKAFMED